MRIFLLALLFSLSALACPDLSGTYQCQSEGEVFHFQVEQNGIIYRARSGSEEWEEFIADGQNRVINIYVPDENGNTQTLPMKQTVRCEGEKLIIKQVPVNGQIRVDITSTVFRPGADNLSIATVVMGNGQRYESSVQCQSQN